MKQVYFEGVFGRLVKVDNVTIVEDLEDYLPPGCMYKGRVIEDCHGWKAGEYVTDFRYRFVHKAGRSGTSLRVHEVQPNELEEES